ncbi:MAG: hypothetical protein IKT57_01215 [Clostridia bacterium]|nr:hypothetical protein [Clostridia bacterium]
MEKNQAKQQGKKKRRGVKSVQKPYLKGTVYNAGALKRSGKILLYYIIYMFFFLMVGAALNFKSMLLNVLLNAGAVVATIGMTYMEGLKNGDSDVSVGEIAHVRRESGREVEKADMDRSYHPLKGALIALIGAAPLLLLGLVHAVCAEPQTYTLGTLPGWLDSISAEEVQLPLAYYNRDTSMGMIQVVRILVRLSLLPYINIISTENIQVLLLLDRISPLLMLLPALGYAAGYLRGPVSRSYTHGKIAANTRRHKRKQQKEQKARQSQNKQII